MKPRELLSDDELFHSVHNFVATHKRTFFAEMIYSCSNCGSLAAGKTIPTFWEDKKCKTDCCKQT